MPYKGFASSWLGEMTVGGAGGAYKDKAKLIYVANMDNVQG